MKVLEVREFFFGFFEQNVLLRFCYAKEKLTTIERLRKLRKLKKKFDDKTSELNILQQDKFKFYDKYFYHIKII